MKINSSVLTDKWTAEEGSAFTPIRGEKQRGDSTDCLAQQVPCRSGWRWEEMGGGGGAARRLGEVGGGEVSNTCSPGLCVSDVVAGGI